VGRGEPQPGDEAKQHHKNPERHPVHIVHRESPRKP
jgi:hypothetical protein